jgi:mannose-6-phosphate isomerase-like protein (cupin superfamily)
MIKKAVVFFFLFFCVLVFLCSAANMKDSSISIEKMLEEFVNDYEKNDELPGSPITFGIQITGEEGGKWAVSIDATKQDKVTLTKGFPSQPTFYVVTDAVTLRKIFNGEINALTAAGRARMSDKAPLDFEFMEGFQPSMDFISDVMLSLGFHFFNRGKPEIIPFGEEYSRIVHGGHAVVFYYQTGLRTAWYKVKPGMYVNKDLKDATNPFPTLFIVTKGEGRGRLGDKIISLREGMTIFIPAGMVHQIWTEGDKSLEGIVIMFGKGA